MPNPIGFLANKPCTQRQKTNNPNPNRLRTPDCPNPNSLKLINPNPLVYTLNHIILIPKP